MNPRAGSKIAKSQIQFSSVVTFYYTPYNSDKLEVVY